MRLERNYSPVHLQLGSTSRSIAPAIVGVMAVLLASVAMSGSNDQKHLVLHLSRPDAAQSGTELHATVRRGMRPESTQSLPIRSASIATRDSIRMLSSSAGTFPVETSTLEIPLADESLTSETIAESKRQLLRLVVKRMANFDLRITIRVSPTDIDHAVKLASEMCSQSPAKLPMIAVSADPRVKRGQVIVDMHRTGHLQPARGLNDE
jgi:hypothetical protein